MTATQPYEGYVLQTFLHCTVHNLSFFLFSDIMETQSLITVSFLPSCSSLHRSDGLEASDQVPPNQPRPLRLADALRSNSALHLLPPLHRLPVFAQRGPGVGHQAAVPHGHLPGEADHHPAAFALAEPQRLRAPRAPQQQPGHHPLHHGKIVYPTLKSTAF